MSLQDSTHFWAILGMQMAASAWSGTCLSKILQIPCSLEYPQSRARVAGRMHLQNSMGFNAVLIILVTMRLLLGVEVVKIPPIFGQS